MINYKSEALEWFKTSSFYRKNKKLLIWFYLYKKGILPSNSEILNQLCKKGIKKRLNYLNRNEHMKILKNEPNKTSALPFGYLYNIAITFDYAGENNTNITLQI